jgi:predicted amidohydrolase
VRTRAVVLMGLMAVANAVLWFGVPAGWFWLGARVYDATGSLLADMTAVFAGVIACLIYGMRGLVRADRRWIALRRAAGREQRDGVLTQVVVASMTVTLALFYLWFYVLSDGAFLIPFMPNR